MKNDKLSGAIQENLLTLLVFDKKSLPLLTNSLKVELFESSIYRNIAQQAISYYQEFKKPLSEHLPDVLEHELLNKDTGRAELYKEVINSLYESRHSVNRDFVLSRLEQFIRQQNWVLTLFEAAEQAEVGNIDKVELIIAKNKKTRLSVFDPGTFFTDIPGMLNFYNIIDNSIPTGIKELDNIGICPASKELFTFAGLSSKGKTWFLINIAKIALLLGKKVLHISLEMSRDRLAQRYMQTLFAFSKRDEVNRVPFFETDNLGRLTSLYYQNVNPKGVFNHPDSVKQLEYKLNKFKRFNLLIKDYPTGVLTITELKAYLENLIEFYNYHPDLIFIDEPDLMALDRDRIRLEIRQTYIELRGLAAEYNTAIVAVSQLNKEAVGKQWLDERYLAEDFNKMRISDNLVTYNQTDLEKENNLARLLVVKGRNDRSGDRILISQNYAMGQFCLSSIRMTKNYWNLLTESVDDGVADPKEPKRVKLFRR